MARRHRSARGHRRCVDDGRPRPRVGVRLVGRSGHQGRGRASAARPMRCVGRPTVSGCGCTTRRPTTRRRRGRVSATTATTSSTSSSSSSAPTSSSPGTSTSRRSVRTARGTTASATPSSSTPVVSWVRSRRTSSSTPVPDVSTGGASKRTSRSHLGSAPCQVTVRVVGPAQYGLSGSRSEPASTSARCVPSRSSSTCGTRPERAAVLFELAVHVVDVRRDPRQPTSEHLGDEPGELGILVEQALGIVDAVDRRSSMATTLADAGVPSSRLISPTMLPASSQRAEHMSVAFDLESAGGQHEQRMGARRRRRSRSPVAS